MEHKNKDPKNRKPNQEGDRGKHIGTAVIISLALILLFTWVYNTNHLFRISGSHGI